MDLHTHACKLTKENMMNKMDIRKSAAAATTFDKSKKRRHTKNKLFESKIVIHPVKATSRNIKECDVIAKENTLVSYESYKHPILLKHQIYKNINYNFGSTHSVTGKEMPKLTESKTLTDEDDMAFLKYIKEPYPVAIKMSYSKTYFTKNRE